MQFDTHSQTTREGEYRESACHREVDTFLVRFPENEKLYWRDISDATEQKMELRFDAEISHPSVNWADKYEFTGEIP